MTIEIADTTLVHRGWSSFSVVTIRLDNGKTLRREVEDHGNAIAVLPYDPGRKTALLVRQFRAASFLASGTTDLLEAIAGVVEEADPAESARREAMEEAGLKLGVLEHVGHAFTSPGISTEQMDLYLASYGTTDRHGPGGGIAEEDIVVVELPLGELATLADSGGLDDMKTFALVQTLRLNHPELFAR